MAEEYGWEWFIKKVREKSSIDLTAYKRPQMERRINSFMRSNGAQDYASFIKMINENHELYRKFIEHLTINVSEFFRNKTHWDVLRNKIIPALLADRNRLKIWSAGCSTGEEPYSLAILMKEYFPGRFDQILATDIDIEALNKAKTGLYSPKAVQAMLPETVNKYFIDEGNYLRIKDDIKQQVRFERHDLLKDPYPTDLDLILCRNVVIYFTEETKDKLYRKFVNALRSKGVLFVGSTEQIFQYRELGLVSVDTFFYQKQVGPGLK